MEKGTITITLDGASIQETERCRLMIMDLFMQGFFSLRNGKAIVHFDSQGMMQQIEYDYVKWRRSKNPACELTPIPIYDKIKSHTTAS